MAQHTSEAGFRASISELFSRTISSDSYSADKLYTRDADNLYPLRIERIINNSPTARRCAELMGKYIIGLGVAEDKDYIVNKRKNLRVNDILRDLRSCISYQNGAYIHVDYTLNLESDTGETLKFGDIEVLDYVRMAKAKDDDDGYSGKFFMLKMEDDEFREVDGDTPWYYPFNPNKKVIIQQMKHDCFLQGILEPTIIDMIRNYRGQVMYVNLTPSYQYALPLVDSVYNDCDTEFRISQYHNTQTRTGFLGKTMIIKQAGDTEEKDDFHEVVGDFLGADNAAHAFIVEVPRDSTIDDLSKAFIVKQLEPQFDDKLFEVTTRTLRQNIMGAFNNIPEPLVFAGTGAMFGTSGDTYLEMKKFYWEQNDVPRAAIESVFKKLGLTIEIIPLKGLENLDVTTSKGVDTSKPENI